jgi:hypothetical protein
MAAGHRGDLGQVSGLQTAGQAYLLTAIQHTTPAAYARCLQKMLRYSSSVLFAGSTCRACQQQQQIAASRQQQGISRRDLVLAAPAMLLLR